MIVGLLLAAGTGERFGHSNGKTKMLAELPDGRSMLYTSVRQMRAALETVVIIVRDEPTLLRQAHAIARELDCLVVVNDRAAGGMATSIVAGVNASPDADGWLIGLGDMPFVKTASIAKIAGMLAGNQGIIVPMHRQQRGHPVGFDKTFRRELLLLDGDTGARVLIDRFPAQITAIELADAGILFDVDTPSNIPKILA